MWEISFHVDWIAGWLKLLIRMMEKLTNEWPCGEGDCKVNKCQIKFPLMLDVYFRTSFKSPRSFRKAFCTSQTHHFSTRLLSYTCHFTAYFRKIKKILLIKIPSNDAVLGLFQAKFCIYTSEAEREEKNSNGWEFAKDWNQINRLKCSYFAARFRQFKRKENSSMD